MSSAQPYGAKLPLPVDTASVSNFPDPSDAPVETTVVPVTAIPADKEGCDIGPETKKLFADADKASKPVGWTGPMGVFEFPGLAEFAGLYKGFNLLFVGLVYGFRNHLGEELIAGVSRLDGDLFAFPAQIFDGLYY